MTISSEAVEGLFRSHAKGVHRMACRRVGEQDAEDILQEAYLHMLERRLEKPVSHPGAYLYRIAANASVDHLRRTKAESAWRSIDEERDPVDQSFLIFVEARRVLAMLAALPPAPRQAFVLSRLDGLTYTQIAKRLGVSSRTIDRYILQVESHLKGAS
jgi:RNA polymerase sigma factor (sigma-70 family)